MRPRELGARVGSFTCPAMYEGLFAFPVPANDPSFSLRQRRQATLPAGRARRGGVGSQLLFAVRVEGFAVHQHVLYDRVTVPVDADHHLHVLCAFHNMAGPLGHEIGADPKVRMASTIDATLDEYLSSDMAAFFGIRR